MEYDHFHFNWNSGHCCWSPLSHQCYRAWAALCNSKSGPLDGFLSCDSFPDLELKSRVILPAILNTCAFKIFPHILSCSVPLTPNDAYTIFSLTSFKKQWLSRCLTAFKRQFFLVFSFIYSFAVIKLIHLKFLCICFQVQQSQQLPCIQETNRPLGQLA